MHTTTDCPQNPLYPEREAPQVYIYFYRETHAVSSNYCGILWLPRVSEYVNLCWHDVSCSEECISITFYQSKIDPFRYGHTIHIFKTKSFIYP